jgi:hypothetical protein
MMVIRKGDWKLLKMGDDAFQADLSVLNGLTGVELYNLDSAVRWPRGCRRRFVVAS